MNEIVAIEDLKVSDWLTVNLGFDLAELERSARHHKIDIKNPSEDLANAVSQIRAEGSKNLNETIFQSYKPSEELT